MYFFILIQEESKQYVKLSWGLCHNAAYPGIFLDVTSSILKMLLKKLMLRSVLFLWRMPTFFSSWFIEDLCFMEKVGGRNNVLEDAINKRIPLVTDFPTIIFGADVTHPAPGEEGSASIAAVCFISTK